MILDPLFAAIGKGLAWFLMKETRGWKPLTTNSPEMLAACLQPGDVLLVEGNQRISTAIKYLTTSTWSHAAFYVGPEAGLRHSETGEILSLIEADLKNGVHAVPLTKYAPFHTRICRAAGISEEDRDHVVSFMVKAIGKQYDLKNVVDLMRYLFPLPPVPGRMRRKMLYLGSGDPTRAICSTLIAEAFHEVRYPILPQRRHVHGEAEGEGHDQDVFRARHHSLIVPRDFDVSPYFEIIKPTLASGFDYRKMVWESDIIHPAPPP
jgi:hypothetical protein